MSEQIATKKTNKLEKILILSKKVKSKFRIVLLLFRIAELKVRVAGPEVKASEIFLLFYLSYLRKKSVYASIC